ncbi:glycosyl hydrolase [Chitinophaga sancti]|uniref:glycoside hydrolase family 26 protein n=1 Tax=Chitinophaga sancti TaxID=1004 RepID=UPI002A757F4C|nr:glycosyl hydrolase [Chitinophaga sancti]WPQ61866.1 glycosyl hydrolase [Chitinophaga sancti]
MLKNICSMMIGLAFSAHAFAQDFPADKQATQETVNLYRNLKKLPEKGYLFGHQDDLAYGVNWRYKSGASDVKEVTGDYPALYGWDLGGIESGKDVNLDQVPFKKIRKYIQEAYERGGVSTISWHVTSPLGAEKGAWDTTHGTVRAILPGGAEHVKYKEWLDNVADFLASLKGKKGEAIPILFRPYHELTGTWFWWGQNACSTDEFITLWRFTIYYLQQVKQLHNLLYVYNTGGEFSREQFLARYPGDDMVDVVSFDTYQWDDPATSNNFVKQTNAQLALLETIAKEKNKIPALAETGYEAVPYAQWWTKTLTDAIGDHHIAYTLLWRNHGYNEWMKKMHYYVPFKGQVSADDFIIYYNQDRTLFQKDVAALSLYK